MICLYYFIGISLLAVILTVYDKKASKRKKGKKKRKRVPEKTLIIVALLGGALAEFVTMRIIRHKTRHRKFMWGLPAIMILHIAVYFAFTYLF